MEEIKYEYENNKNYLTIQAKEPRENDYRLQMLLHNDIPGLLSVSLRTINNRTYYYYDTAAGKPLSQLYEFGKMQWEDVVLICSSIDYMTMAVDRYLLDIQSVMLFPEYMYLNMTEKEIQYIYNPDISEDFQTRLRELFEFILEHYQHGTDTVHQMQVYEIYQKIADGAYKIHCISQLTKSNQKVSDGEDTVMEYEHENEEVIEEIAPEIVESEEETIPQTKLTAAKTGMAVSAAVSAYSAAALFLPETVWHPFGVSVSIMLLLAGSAGCVFFYKLYRHLKENGELIQLKEPQNYSYIPECKEQEIQPQVSQNNCDSKEYNEYDGNNGNTMLLSEYLQRKKAQKIVLVLQNQEELDSCFDESLTADIFPCAVGNMAAYCRLVIHSDFISKLHACLYKEDSLFYLEDMNSTNGTFLNGKRLIPKERQQLKAGDTIGLANMVYKVEMR